MLNRATRERNSHSPSVRPETVDITEVTDKESIRVLHDKKRASMRVDWRALTRHMELLWRPLKRTRLSHDDTRQIVIRMTVLSRSELASLNVLSSVSASLSTALPARCHSRVLRKLSRIL